MSYTIRPLRTEDYPAATEIYNTQNEPHHHLTVEELRRSDERAQERSFYRLLSAVKDGEISARGQVGERPGDDPPGKFWALYFVRGDHRGTGVDTAMFDRSLELLADRGPRSLWTCLREDFVPAAAYLTDRGYEEQFRSWSANLNLKGFEPSRFHGLKAALAQLGIELRTYAGSLPTPSATRSSRNCRPSSRTTRRTASRSSPSAIPPRIIRGCCWTVTWSPCTMASTWAWPASRASHASAPLPVAASPA